MVDIGPASIVTTTRGSTASIALWNWRHTATSRTSRNAHIAARQPPLVIGVGLVGASFGVILAGGTMTAQPRTKDARVGRLLVKRSWTFQPIRNFPQESDIQRSWSRRRLQHRGQRPSPRRKRREMGRCGLWRRSGPIVAPAPIPTVVSPSMIIGSSTPKVQGTSEAPATSTFAEPRGTAPIALPRRLWRHPRRLAATAATLSAPLQRACVNHALYTSSNTKCPAHRDSGTINRSICW